MHRLRRALVGLCILCAVPAVLAQPAALPWQTLSLSDLSAFDDPTANWQAAGAVAADRNVDRMLTAEPGQGVLVNLPTDGANANLFTAWRHGDLDLDIEYMMPKGSNSGLYFMGRYEVQLLDSWGVKAPRFADAAGIYQRWDPERGEGNEGFEGAPPAMNVSRAPGLWQHLRIRFRAPRFDDEGRKVTEAMFEYVEHNGVRVHENVIVSGPTRAAAFDDEQPMGPLMIQGDHGPVAFRNIRYKRYRGAQIELVGATYRYYEGQISHLENIGNATLVSEGATDSLSQRIASARDKIVLEFEGTLRIPAGGQYLFVLGATGPARFEIGGRSVLDINDGRWNNGREATTVTLREGEVPFRLTYSKPGPGWRPPSLDLSYEGPEIEKQTLTSPTSQHQYGPPEPILVEPEGEAVVHRGFMRNGEGKRTGAIAIGDPTGQHYAYDVEDAALVSVWRGGFIDATQMWHERGEPQLARPTGSELVFTGKPTLAAADAVRTAWPTEADAGFKRYTFAEMGRPVFMLEQHGWAITDAIRPDDEGRYLVRTLTFEPGDGAEDVLVLLAQAESIEPMASGEYRIGDYAAYLSTSAPAELRTLDGQATLVVPVPAGNAFTLNYAMIW
ncbi:MAG: family 16 glycoside hydrolase [Bacteroidota bacterium]